MYLQNSKLNLIVFLQNFYAFVSDYEFLKHIYNMYESY